MTAMVACGCFSTVSRPTREDKEGGGEQQPRSFTPQQAAEAMPAATEATAAAAAATVTMAAEALAARGI